MTTTTGPRPMTDAETEAFTLHLQKVPVPSIQIKTGLVPSQIAAAVDLGQVHARLKLAGVAAAMATAEKPTPAAAPKTSADSTAEGYLTTTKLLTWAEQSSLTRALTLAARIREQLEELRALHRQTDARAKAQAEVDRLTAELEAAKAALKQAGTVRATPRRPAGAKPDADRKERLKAIRAWAPGAGFEVSPLGQIPKHIEAAYDAAHETQVTS